MKGIVFALVGPSGTGKTALIEDMLKRFSDELVILPSLTTRPRRNAEDDRSTRFVSREEFERLREVGELVQASEYAGNLYGDVSQDVNDIVDSGRHAIRPLVETAVRSFRDKGYRVVMIRVVPEGDAYRNRDPQRVTLDERRANEALPADVEIRNSFEPGGFEVAAQELSSFIRATIDRVEG